MASVCASTWSTPTSSVAAPAKPNRTQLRVGRLVKAHGLKGALKVELYTDDPARRFTPGATFTLQVPTTSEWHGKSLELVELRPGIDAIALIARRLAPHTSPRIDRVWGRWWGNRSPLNRYLDVYGAARRMDARALNATKLLFCGQFAFQARPATPSSGGD